LGGHEIAVEMGPVDLIAEFERGQADSGGFQGCKLDREPGLEFCGISIGQGRLRPLQPYRRIRWTGVDAGTALGGVHNRDRADATCISTGDKTRETFANPGADLHAVLSQLRNEGVLLLLLHLLDADDVHADPLSPSKLEQD
jgi:hypothetical protein